MDMHCNNDQQDRRNLHLEFYSALSMCNLLAPTVRSPYGSLGDTILLAIVRCQKADPCHHLPEICEG